MRWEVEFYKDSSGKEPVIEFLNTLPSSIRAKVARLLDLLSEQGVLLKEPYTRQIRGKLRELRIKDHLGKYPDYLLYIYRQEAYFTAWLYKENR